MTFRIGNSSRPAIECARCGERLIAPERSEYVVDDGAVRHLWECEACDHAFATIYCTSR